MSKAISYGDFKVNIEFLYKNRKYEELVATVDRFKNTSFFESIEIKKLYCRALAILGKFEEAGRVFPIYDLCNENLIRYEATELAKFLAKICKYEELKKLLRSNSDKISTDTLIEVVEICYFNWNYELAEEIAMSIVNTSELVPSKLVNILLEINKRKITEQGDAVFFPYLRSIQAEDFVRKGTIVVVDGLSKLCPENSSFVTSKGTNISMEEKCTYLIYKEVWDENSGELEYYAIPIDLEQNIPLRRVRIIRPNDIEYYLPSDIYLTDKLLRNIKATGILHKVGYYNITTRELQPNKSYSTAKRRELTRKKKPIKTE